MKIIQVPDLGSTPARVHRPSGTVYLNMRLWPLIDTKVQKVILAHEAGHHYLNTKSELKADEFAFKKYALTEKGSLKALYRAVTRHLNMQNPQHRKRAATQIKRILQTDAALGNAKAVKILKQMNEQSINQLRIKIMAENPTASMEEIDTALLFAAAIKDETDNYSDFGKRKPRQKTKYRPYKDLKQK